ncbi:hypothetical protein B0T25DRAFT_270029 [Lasiosphaeria hispida]|uniref:FAD-binding domain-containing protein n=1 Tax=Lasiosphaeria hispida TaxID=260671 RepID=A0AAJ0HAS4_9PEZI|nr:hypothetical protein B0T25DRAFT_270029 [Lasiosphaeria hispida]
MRVIIVGAGPAGLVLAHALLRAGIDDFVVLERRSDVVEASGAGLGLWPHSVRVLDQLGNGLLEAAQKMAPRMEKSLRLGAKGEVILETNLFSQIEENHGHPFMLFERARLIQLLHAHLPNASTRIHTNKHVTSLSQTPSAITVSCADGTSYTGSIVLGADGVHSTIRRLLLPALRTPFTATYQCLFGTSPLPALLPPGEMTELASGPLSIQILTTPTLAVWFLYLRHPTPRPPSTSSYPDAEMHALAARYAAHAASHSGLLFRDLWDSRIRAKLVDLEEGVLRTWSAGRAALVGDAAHKMASNLALGANSAVESAVVLVNGLRALVQREGPEPGAEGVRAVLEGWQREREGRVGWCVWVSGSMLGWAGWLNWGLWFLGLFGAAGDERLVADVVLPWVARDGVVLDFVPETGGKVGRVPWTHASPELLN